MLTIRDGYLSAAYFKLELTQGKFYHGIQLCHLGYSCIKAIHVVTAAVSKTFSRLIYSIQKKDVQDLHLEFFQWMCYFWHLQCPIYALLLHSKTDFKPFGFSLLLSEQDLLQLLFPAFQYRLWTAIYRIVLRPFLERPVKAFILIILTEIKINLCNKIKNKIQATHSLSSFNNYVSPQNHISLFFTDRSEQKVFNFSLKISFPPILRQVTGQIAGISFHPMSRWPEPWKQHGNQTQGCPDSTQRHVEGTWQILTWSVFQNFKRFRLLCAGTALCQD